MGVCPWGRPLSFCESRVCEEGVCSLTPHTGLQRTVLRAVPPLGRGPQEMCPPARVDMASLEVSAPLRLGVLGSFPSLAACGYLSKAEPNLALEGDTKFPGPAAV